MKKIIYLTLLTALLIACSKTKEWKTYKYNEFNFTVEFPYEPEFTVKIIDDLKYNLLVSKSRAPGLKFTSYSVFYVDLKNFLNSNDSSLVKKYFEILDEQSTVLNPVRIISQREFQYFNYPAKEYVKEFADGNQIQVSRFIFVNDKSYQLDMVYPTVEKDNPEHNKFIESFRLGT
jgi:hypothetical protein